jgi:hypothetical protein
MSSLQAGDTFVLADSHLWIVLSDPNKNAGKFIFVNLTSDVLRAGIHCELSVGDHPWIVKKTYVNFGDAMEGTPESESRLLALIGRGVTKHDPLSQELLSRIVAAGKITKALSRKLKTYLPGSA